MPGQAPMDQVSPALVLVALVIEEANLRPVTVDFLRLKSEYPHVRTSDSRLFERIDAEVKGSTLRKAWRDGTAAEPHRIATVAVEGLPG